ncbi:HTH domain-containing protein [Paenibacillus athensensis]|nr:helix-turn-helix domain-containing protein [Paenibacillus athensensis]MCD1259602.1 HTH domain-containing protein [Paenibacillus athensensis]
MEEVVLHLKNLGFTELEAKCLHVLLETGAMTGYEIAKRLGVSRSNVYVALQKLVEKGVALASKGEPTHYQSVPIEEIGDRVEAELQASIRFVKEHLPKRDAMRTEYFSVEGDQKVLERIRAELRQTREEALCDLWAEEAGLLAPELRLAQAGGARVLVSLVGETELDGIECVPHGREESWRQEHGRKFTLLLDRRLAIIGTRGGGGEPAKAMLTEHPAMAALLLNNFFHDLVMYELHKDMGPKLEDKYGKNFKRLIQKYTEARGADGKAEGKGESKAEGKAEGRGEGKAEGKAEGRGEGKGEGKAEGKAEGRGEGKADGKAEGKGEGKADGGKRKKKK